MGFDFGQYKQIHLSNTLSSTLIVCDVVQYAVLHEGGCLTADVAGVSVWISDL